jgi:hypothetical protein
MVLECLGYGVYTEACKQEVAVWMIGLVAIIITVILGYILAKRKYLPVKKGD